MTRATILTILLGIATLGGCVFPGVHKLNVQQGNIVTADMLEQLKPGMTQRQVEFVMGTPVMRNPFESRRWDYLYTLEQRDVVTKEYRIQVFFDAEGRYTHYTGTLPDPEFHEDVDPGLEVPSDSSPVNTLQPTPAG